MASSRGGKKMWCVPEISSEFIDRMEDVLRLYARKLDPDEPVVCLDERPVVLREDGRRLWRRFVLHYTPKHASWLNAAELEASLVSRECLGQRRIPSLVDLISLVAAWRRRAEEEHRIIEWRFRVDDARRVFRYEGLTTRRSGH